MILLILVTHLYHKFTLTIWSWEIKPNLFAPILLSYTSWRSNLEQQETIFRHESSKLQKKNTEIKWKMNFHFFAYMWKQKVQVTHHWICKLPRQGSKWHWKLLIFWEELWNIKEESLIWEKYCYTMSQQRTSTSKFTLVVLLHFKLAGLLKSKSTDNLDISPIPHREKLSLSLLVGRSTVAETIQV